MSALTSPQVDLMRRYTRARREAHEFRLTGEVDKALIAEELAQGYQAEAADGDAPFAPWERLMGLCDELATSPAIHPVAAWERIVPMTREQKRASAIAQLNRRFPVAEQHDRVILQELGMADPTGWGEWIVQNADDAGMSRGNAAMLFDLLAPSEAFDGFVTAVEDGQNGEE